ncbi:MAG: hypothetical protein R2804_05265 [Cyclobacteriaceae bacterium]
MNFSLRVVGIFLLGIAFSLPSTAQNDDEFSLVREEDSIYVYERWIIFPDSDPPLNAREVKGEFFVNTSIQKAYKLLKDENKIMDWQKHVTEFKVYPLPTDTAWREYSYHDIPWPVSDQDHFLIYCIEKRDNDKMFISFKSTYDEAVSPERDGVTRMNLLGSWTFQKITDSKIKATYRIISQPSSIPRIFTDPVIRRNLMSTIKSYIKILEEKK